MATLGAIFLGSYAATGSGAKPKTAAGPPINASSKEEGDFIQYVTRDLDNAPTGTHCIFPTLRTPAVEICIWNFERTDN